MLTPEQVVGAWIIDASQRFRLSQRHLASVTGIHRNKIGALAKGEHVGLTVTELSAIADQLGRDPCQAISANQVPSYESQEPTAQDVAAWLLARGSSLDMTHPFCEYLTLVEIPRPTDPAIRVRSLGKSSLASKMMHSQDPNLINAFINQTDEQDRISMTRDYLTAAECGHPVFLRRSRPHPQFTDKSVEMPYVTILLECRLPDGEMILANASSQLALVGNG